MAEPNGLEIVAAINKLTENADNLDPEVVKDTLDSLKASLSDKLEAINWKITDNKRDLASLNVDMDEMKARRNTIKRIERQNKSLEQYMTVLIEATGKDKVRTGKHVFRTGWASHSVNITDPDKLPQDFVKTETTYKPDKKAIGQAIKNGHDIPGAEMITTKHTRVY